MKQEQKELEVLRAQIKALKGATVIQDGKKGGNPTGKWVGRLRYIDGLGRAKAIERSCDDEANACEAILREHAKLMTGVIADSAEPTLAEWLETCMETIFSPRVRPNTLVLYRGFQNHLAGLGNLKLSQLTVDKIEGYLRDLKMASSAYRKEGKLVRTFVPMSHVTKAKVRRFLINCLNHAMRRQKLTQNVAALTMLEGKTTKKKVRALSLEQAKLLISKIKTNQYKALFGLQLMSGLRIAEALGIKWTDLDGDKLQVQRQVQRVPVGEGKTAVMDQPLKTECAVRSVGVAPWVLELMASLPRKGPYVFHTKKGSPIEPRNAKRAITAIAKNAELVGVATHVLRHTFGRLSIQSGMNIIDLRDSLGHTDSRTTNIYAEGSYESVKTAQEKVWSLFDKEKQA